MAFDELNYIVCIFLRMFKMIKSEFCNNKIHLLVGTNLQSLNYNIFYFWGKRVGVLLKFTKFQYIFKL